MKVDMNVRVVAAVAVLVLVVASIATGVGLWLGKSGFADPVSATLVAGEETVLSNETGAKIVIPSGATSPIPGGEPSEAITVSIKEIEPPDSPVDVGRVFDFSIGEAILLEPVTLHIPFELDAGQSAKQIIALHWLEEHAIWEELQGEVNEIERTIAVTVLELSLFSTIFADWDCPSVNGDTTPHIVPKVLEVTLVPESPLAGDDITVKFRVANEGTHCLSTVDGTGQIFLTSPGPRQNRGKLRAVRVLGDKWKPGVALRTGTTHGVDEDLDNAMAHFTVENAEPGRQQFQVELVFWDEDGEEIGRHQLAEEIVVTKSPELELTRVRVDSRDYLVEGAARDDGTVEYKTYPNLANDLLNQKKAIYTALTFRDLQRRQWSSALGQFRLAYMEYGAYLVFGSKLALNGLIVAFSPSLYSKARALAQIPVDILLKWKEESTPGTAKTITGAVALEIGNHVSDLFRTNQYYKDRGRVLTFADALEVNNNRVYDAAYWDPALQTVHRLNLGRWADWNDESDLLMARAALVPFEYFFAGKVATEVVEVIAVASLLGGLNEALRDFTPWNQMVSEVDGNLVDQRAAYSKFLDSLGIEDHEPFQLPVLTKIDIPHYEELDIISPQTPTPISTPQTPTPISTPSPGPTSNPVPPITDTSDRNALVALYEATSGAGWKNNVQGTQPWLIDDANSSIGDWYGVKTAEDDEDRVIRLIVEENCLRGRLPPEIGNLVHLEVLILQWNSRLGCDGLEGAIPTSLGNLTQLWMLDLSENRLSGEIPTALGENLFNLEVLDLSKNRLRGSIPASLGKLTDLTELDLSGNQLGGGIPAELGNLANLEVLRLSGRGNQFDGCIPVGLQDVPTNDLAALDLEPCDADNDSAEVGDGGVSQPTPVGTGGDATAPGPPDALLTDREALVELYNATDGDNWENNSNWLSSAPIREWYGVWVDSDGRVTSLSMFDNGLRGTIPPQLGNLTKLEGLQLSRGQLSGTIPPELGGLTNLRSLFLDTNQLSGPIPPALGNLTNLAHLNLGANQLSGTIPPALGNLTNLTVLLLDLNQLSGTIPDELSDLAILHSLMLGANQLSGTIPSSLGNLTNLRRLHLSRNQLSGTIPSSLGNLTNLLSLILAENQLSGAIPSSLGNLTNLTTLRLDLNQLSGTIPSSLGNLTNLNFLFLDTNQLSGMIPSALKNLTNLRHLRLAYNQLIGCMLSELRYVRKNDFGNLGLPFCEDTPESSPKLRQIRDRGKLICASRDEVPGFDIDLCRALATAVLGDPNAIEVQPVTGQMIPSGEVDMLVGSATWTTSGDAQWGNYVQTMFYDGQGFLVDKASGISSALDLKDAAVCVAHGSTFELNLADFSNQNDLNIVPLTFEDAEIVVIAYELGQCDASTADRSQLAVLLGSVLSNPGGHVILPETISEETLGLVVPRGDDQWFDVVKTVMSILIYAEAYGVDSGNVPSAVTGDARVDRLFGLVDSFGQENLGMSQTVAQDVVRAVGNYGEIYQRNLGLDGISLPRENSDNALWGDAPCTNCPKGGKIYAEPLW